MSSAKVCQAPGVAAGYPAKGRKEGKPIEPPSTRPDIWAAAPCPAIRAVVRTARHTLAALFRFCPPPAASARCLHTHPVASRPASILHVRPAVSAPARVPTSVPRASAQAFDAPAGLLAPPSAAGSSQPFQRPPGLPSTRLACPFYPVRHPESSGPPQPAGPNSETGLFLSNEGKRGIQRAAVKLSEGGGGVEAYGLHPRPPACAAAHTVTHQRAGDARAGKSCNFFASLQLFQRCLLVVVPLAKALMVRRIDELLPVATVRDDVVHHRGPCSVPRIVGRVRSRALAAPGLTEQLRWAQTLRPDR